MLILSYTYILASKKARHELQPFPERSTHDELFLSDDLMAMPTKLV